MKEGIHNTKIEDIEGDIVHLLHADGERSQKDIAPFPQHLRKIGAFVAITKTVKPGEVIIKYEQGKEFTLICTCPTTCDCQNPPPKDWDGKNGAYGVSESCPVHNLHPAPNPDCPIHGN
ncbi:MAG: hypothetical protein WC875_04180 [Candidatus Absconditabacterales bacterium]|jgi:hypothetical protein